MNPNSSSKDNRGSVWTLLATLVLNWEKKNPGAYTYPLAVGPDVSLDDSTIFVHRQNLTRTFIYSLAAMKKC